MRRGGGREPVSVGGDAGSHRLDAVGTAVVVALLLALVPLHATNARAQCVADSDLDTVPDDVDCAPLDPRARAFPDEVTGVRVERAAGGVLLSWAPAAPGSTTHFDVLTGQVSNLYEDDGFARATCFGPTPLDFVLDLRGPPDRRLATWYLVRAVGACGAGTYGDSSVTPDRRDPLDRPGQIPCALPDRDGDGLDMQDDNCPDDATPTPDTDSDGLGDLCDSCPLVNDVPGCDSDLDGVGDACDDCPIAPDPLQLDGDANGIGDACDCGGAGDRDFDGLADACDPCPDDPTAPVSADTDADGRGNACDTCARDADDDADSDALCADVDNCPSVANAAQTDGDGDRRGDACDGCPTVADAGWDSDGDGTGDACDTCPLVSNASQADADGDGRGDPCDTCLALADNPGDSDADGFGDACDLCPFDADPLQSDTDVDGIGDACDRCQRGDDHIDSDGDGVPDACDICPLVFNPVQADVDRDVVGDACDNCVRDANASQADADADGAGDACDACPGADDRIDSDVDGAADGCDTCPLVADPAQQDSDGDDVGDACDDCPSNPDPAQSDLDGDGLGDACDDCPSVDDPTNADTDLDNIGDACDNCPQRSNQLQEDLDGDGVGDVCDANVLGWELSDQAPGVSEPDAVPAIGEDLFLDLLLDHDGVAVTVTSLSPYVTVTDGATRVPAGSGSSEVWTVHPVTLRLDPAIDCSLPIELRVSLRGDRLTDREPILSIPLQSTSVLLASDFASGAAGWTGTGAWHLLDEGVEGMRWWSGDDGTCTYSRGGVLSSPLIAGVETGGTVSLRYRQATECWWGGAGPTVELVAEDGSMLAQLGRLIGNDGAWHVFGPIALPPVTLGRARLQITFPAGSSDAYQGLEIARVSVRAPGSACPVATVPRVPGPGRTNPTGDADSLALLGQRLVEDRRLAEAYDATTAALNADPSHSRAAVLRAVATIAGPLAEGWEGAGATQVDSWWELLDGFGATRARREPVWRVEACEQRREGLPDVLPDDAPDADEVRGFLADAFRMEIRAALDDFARATDPTFAMLLDASVQASDRRCSAPREMDATDVRVARALLGGLDAVLSILVAQDFAAVDIDRLANMPDVQYQRDILDPHPDFLRLGPTALAELADADAALRRAHSQAVLALDALRAEADDQTDDLVTWNDIFNLPEDETNLRNTLDTWRDALDGPTFITFGSSPRRVDLRPFFTARVVTRAIVPDYVAVLSDGSTVEVSDAATVVPADLTLAGMFPDATREDWLDARDKYGSASGTPVVGRPDGLVVVVLAGSSASCDITTLDLPGDDVLFHVTDAVGTYSVRFYGWDAAGMSAQSVVGDLSGSASIDLAGTGLVFVTECRLEVDSGQVSWDAVEALH